LGIITPDSSALRESRGSPEQGTQNRQRLVDPVRLINFLIGAVLARDEQHQQRGGALAGVECSGEIGHGGDLLPPGLKVGAFCPESQRESAAMSRSAGGSA